MKLKEGSFKDHLEEGIAHYNRMPNWLKTNDEDHDKPELYDLMGQWVDIKNNIEIKKLNKRISKLEEIVNKLVSEKVN